MGCYYANMSPSDKEVSVESLILRRPLRPVGLLYSFGGGGSVVANMIPSDMPVNSI